MAQEPEERRAQHLANQNKYVQRKSSTHTRVTTWVPQDAVEEFRKVVARFRRKWDKGSA